MRPRRATLSCLVSPSTSEAWASDKDFLLAIRQRISALSRASAACREATSSDPRPTPELSMSEGSQTGKDGEMPTIDKRPGERTRGRPPEPRYLIKSSLLDAGANHNDPRCGKGEKGGWRQTEVRRGKGGNSKPEDRWETHQPPRLDQA